RPASVIPFNTLHWFASSIAFSSGSIPVLFIPTLRSIKTETVMLCEINTEDCSCATLRQHLSFGNRCTFEFADAGLQHKSHHIRRFVCLNMGPQLSYISHHFNCQLNIVFYPIREYNQRW